MYLQNPTSGIIPDGFAEDNRWSVAFLRTLLEGHDVPMTITVHASIDGLPAPHLSGLSFPELPEELL